MASDNPVDGRDKLVTLLHAFNFPLTPEVTSLIGLMGSDFAGEFEALLRIRLLTQQMIDLLEQMKTNAEGTENSADQVDSEKELPDNVIPFNGDPAEA